MKEKKKLHKSSIKFRFYQLQNLSFHLYSVATKTEKRSGHTRAHRVHRVQGRTPPPPPHPRALQFHGNTFWICFAFFRPQRIYTLIKTSPGLLLPFFFLTFSFGGLQCWKMAPKIEAVPPLRRLPPPPRRSTTGCGCTTRRGGGKQIARCTQRPE